MPIAILVYGLPDEQEDFDEARRAGAVRGAWGDVWNKVRSKLKYEELSDEQAAAYEQVRSWFAEACETWEVDVP